MKPPAQATSRRRPVQGMGATALLQREGASNELAVWTVRSVQTFAGRLGMVEELGGTKIGDVAKSLGKDQFMEDWEELRRMRNDVVHQGRTYAFPADLDARLESATLTGVTVFAEVNNCIWQTKPRVASEGVLSCLASITPVNGDHERHKAP